jgi:hypothetical protein
MKQKSPIILVAAALGSIALSTPLYAADLNSQQPESASAPNAAMPAAAPGANAFVEALKDGTFYWQERYRYEDDKQGGFANDGQANTLRTILGYKTGVYQNFQVDFAGLNVTQFGDHDYNDGIDGRTKFPAIGDPGNTQILHASLTYTGLPQTTLIGGRQEIALDNQRWVGAPSWRQTIQTFDGITAKNTSIDNWELFYGYLFDQNRSQGVNVTNGQYDMSTNLFHAAYTGIKDVKLIGYSYLTSITNIPSLSNATTGIRAEAKYPVVGDLNVTGNGEYARQVNYGNNPQDYGLNYYLIEPGLAYRKLTGKLGYEVLSGNGVEAVQSPMMAPHPMNGWADQFTTTPLAGLHDQYINAAYKFQLPVRGLDESKIEGFFHVYNADRTSLHYGNEYDLDFTQKIADHYAIGAQLEDYQADHLLKDDRKIVLTLQFDY